MARDRLSLVFRWGSGSSSSCGSREELAAPLEAEATSLATSVNRLLHSEGLPTSDDDDGSCSSTEDMAEGEDEQAATATAGVSSLFPFPVSHET